MTNQDTTPHSPGLCPFGNSKCGPKTLCFQLETDFVMSSQFADIEESSATTRSCNNVSAADSPIDRPWMLAVGSYRQRIQMDKVQFWTLSIRRPNRARQTSG